MKAKKILITFFIALPILIFGRFFQLYSMIDPSTGFFLNDYADLAVTMCIVGAAVLLFILVMSIAKRDYPDKLATVSTPLGGVSILFGLVILVTAAGFISEGNLFTISSPPLSVDFSFSGLIYIILLIMSAVAFCLFGIFHITGTKKGMILMIFPIVLYVWRLISAFIDYTGIANISENIIDLIMLCCSLIFILLHAKIINGINYKINMPAAVGFGLAASLLCAVSTIPRYVLMIIGRSDLLHEGTTANPIDAGLMIYIVVFLIVYLKAENHPQK